MIDNDNISFRAWNGRYRPTFWGALPLRVVMPLMGTSLLGIAAFLLILHHPTNRELVIGCLCAVAALMFLVLAINRFIKLDKEELERIGLHAKQLKSAKDVAL